MPPAVETWAPIFKAFLLSEDVPRPGRGGVSKIAREARNRGTRNRDKKRKKLVSK